MFGGIEMNGKGARHTCPKCDSVDIESSDGEFGSTNASCKVVCHECEFRWYEYFKAISWEELK